MIIFKKLDSSLFQSKGIKVPQELGVFGFANEAFSNLIKPSLSSVDQKSKDLGKIAAKIYFEEIKKGAGSKIKAQAKVVKCEIIVRDSSKR